MVIELDMEINGKDKRRHAQIKIDDLMSASTKPLKKACIVRAIDLKGLLLFLEKCPVDLHLVVLARFLW